MMLHIIALLCVGVVDGYSSPSTRGIIKTNGHSLLQKTPDAPVATKSDRDDKNDKNDSDPSHKKYEMQYANDAKRDKPGEAPKYPVIMALHHKLGKIFGRYTDTWYLDWKLWVGASFWLAVWGKWVKQGYDDEMYHIRALFAFGLNILILHILQYAETIKFGMVFVIGILSAQALFQTMIWFKAEAEHSDELEDFVCDTLYLDLVLPMEQILVLFVAQIGVWWFYMTSILGNFDFEHVNYLFWFLSFLTMQMTMIFNRGADSVLGNAFPVHDVHRMFQLAGKVQFTLEVDDPDSATPRTRVGLKPFALSKLSIFSRGIMGYFCNSILREIMAYTIPLMLMGFSEPMDFVVYCVGVNFICTLDDMSERKYSLAREIVPSRRLTV